MRDVHQAARIDERDRGIADLRVTEATANRPLFECAHARF
jgi:hypothetical protein